MNVYYMWDEHSPLNVYTNHSQSARLGPGYYKQWASYSALYGEYGNYLMKRHLVDFVRYFMGPNTVNFLRPNPEFLGIYNTGFDSISNVAVVWFELTTNKVYNTNHTKYIKSMIREGVFQRIISLVFLITFIGLTISGMFRKITFLSKKLISIVGLVWMANFSFSIFSSIVILRYQAGSIVITTCFDVFFILLIIQRVIKLFPFYRRKTERFPVFNGNRIL